MEAWVVRGKGEPWEVFRREDFPEPTPEIMQDYALGLDGLHPRGPGEPACEDYVLMRVSAAALAWPDLTMATGEYPVPIPRPYVSGQEAVGIVERASPSLAHLEGKRASSPSPRSPSAASPRSAWRRHRRSSRRPRTSTTRRPRPS